MQWLLLCFLTLLGAGEVLVLKNGKKMLAERVERNGGTVSITHKGQTFALPENMVNWEASAKATEEWRERVETDQNARRKAAEAKRQAEEERYKLKDPTGLTNKNYQSSRPAATSGKITLEYRLEGNNIIVGLHLNKRGPFDIVLDTGASKTVIDPALLEQVGGSNTGQSIPMTGVAGKIVHAKMYKMNELSLAGARVSSMSVLGNRIHALTSGGIYGLLGQDFLNHFIVNINTATKVITLEPHNLHNNQGTEAFDPRQFGEQLETFFRELDQVGRDTLRYTDDLVRRDQAERRVMSQLRGKTTRLKQESSSLFSKIGRLDEEALSEEGRQSVQRLRTCQPGLSRIFRVLDSLNSSLAQSRKLEGDRGAVTEYKGELLNKARTVRESFNQYRDCL
ncbi:retropepsin-like aspartic protease [Acanthopleuribacter pedis]|uniref:Clan AA aspartic protease n=1 Tax=Acanthopleuribacter pedis TaxID=442870 RepID=A0A8J7Q0L2_9BACT|nr:retropepsin-like aspartic protease [Acanthopleuribacter pedis]MBO1318202.1 clan AA aspartic protease [Acanthopleuribacter pedis]